MKSVRLLPIVICAAIALLLFKGLGLITNGGYVLTGVTVAEAAGGTDHGGASAGGEGGDSTMTIASEPTMTDASPTLSDVAPTLPGAGGEGDGHGTKAADTGHGAGQAEQVAEGGATEGHGAETAEGSEAEGHGAEMAEGGESEGHGAESAPLPADPACAEAATAPADAHGGESATEQDCSIASDTVITMRNGAGEEVPIPAADGVVPTEATILERLSERRTELEALEAELALRTALMEAAEKRIAERTKALEALETRINTMVDQKAAMEDGAFTALVGMYETMKATEAAQIFNQLDIAVLNRVARGMNPRKMAPILAKMDPVRAQELTVLLAANESEPTMDVQAEDLAALPQIVGQ